MPIVIIDALTDMPLWRTSFSPPGANFYYGRSHGHAAVTDISLTDTLQREINVFLAEFGKRIEPAALVSELGGVQIIRNANFF